MQITVTLNLLSVLPLPPERTTLWFPIGATTTIGDVIGWVDREHPGFASAVRHPGGGLSKNFIFFVNGTNIQSLGGEQAPLKANDVVNVIPAIAGG